MIQHPIAILSSNYSLALDENNIQSGEISKKEVSQLYQKTKWRNSTLTDTLYNITQRTELLVIRTDNLIVIDFDDDAAFKEALEFNTYLSTQAKCNFIVQSARKGGHFYFAPNPAVPELIGHSKQAIFDYLTGPGHNVIAPSLGDRGKTLITPLTEDTQLTLYSIVWDKFLQVIIDFNVSQHNLSTIINTHTEAHSDDNSGFIKAYLSNIVTQAEFDKFYNIVSPIPQGMSNKYYLQLSTRLGCDETVSWEDYSQAIIKFNLFHQRKTPQELVSEIMDRMKPTGNEAQTTSVNKLWRYNPDKLKADISFTHKNYKTAIHTYYDENTGEYIVSYQDSSSQHHLKVRRSKSLYLDLMEKIVINAQATKKTEKILSVSTIVDYSKPHGINLATREFNKAIITPELAAFNGVKPHNYSVPYRLLEACEYMWADETQYLLSHTKYRYETFRFSPVITFLQGTEGSGKDLTIHLLTKGFPGSPQLLNAQLLKDVHSNWQTEPNAVISELGDWRTIDRETLLATIKTISGSHGMVTYRGMQQTAITIQSQIKIWVTGNSWVKLHTDALSQRRIYPVYMPRPLSKIMGGPYAEGELREIFSAENILNFYYYLGNEYEHSLSFDDYMNPKSRQKSESYEMYKASTGSKADMVADMLYKRDWALFEQALAHYELSLNDLTWKFSRDRQLVISMQSLKEAFREGGATISQLLDRIKVDLEGNKRLKFDGPNVEHFMTVYNAPIEMLNGLNITHIDGEDDGL